jgi:hypothetical protein
MTSRGDLKLPSLVASDYSEIRRHDLVMSSMPARVSCGSSATEMLRQRRGNPGVGIQSEATQLICVCNGTPLSGLCGRGTFAAAADELVRIWTEQRSGCV